MAKRSHLGFGIYMMLILQMNQLPIVTFQYVTGKRERYDGVLMEGQKSLFQLSHFGVTWNRIILPNTRRQ